VALLDSLATVAAKSRRGQRSKHRQGGGTILRVWIGEKVKGSRIWRKFKTGQDI
jgi:hypothetical protein